MLASLGRGQDQSCCERADDRRQTDQVGNGCQRYREDDRVDNQGSPRLQVSDPADQRGRSKEKCPTASCAGVRWNALECARVRHNLGTNFRTYWITWSARPTSDCGSVSPRASAIFFNRLREPPGITGTQKRIKGLSGGSPNSIRPADP